jgi:hypothetical protein
MPISEALLNPSAQQIIKIPNPIIARESLSYWNSKDSYFVTITRKHETIQICFTITVCGDINSLEF